MPFPISDYVKEVIVMHMADALLSTAVAGTMYVASTGAAAYSIKKVKEEADFRKIPVMGVMGALVFATQMLNFTIPGTGSSGHLCGGMLVSAMLGPFAGFLTMIGILLIQCLLFADGGVLALGANVWNMAFYGCFIGALLIWKPIMKNGASRAKIIIASIAGCVITLQMGAFSVVLQTLASGITELPFSIFVGFMQPIHLAIGLVEGLITAAVLLFVYETRPEMLWGVGVESKENKLSAKKVLLVITAVAIIFSGAVSLYASSNPDGLEWSLERVTGSPELEAEGSAYETAESIQEATAILPDYTWKDATEDNESLGTSFSGVFGSLLVVAVFGLFGMVWKSAAGKNRA